MAVVEWRETKTRQNYRAGYQGKVCVCVCMCVCVFGGYKCRQDQGREHAFLSLLDILLSGQLQVQCDLRVTLFGELL